MQPFLCLPPHLPTSAHAPSPPAVLTQHSALAGPHCSSAHSPPLPLLRAALITEMCKSLPPAGLPQALLVLGHLAATQPHFTSLPDRGFKHLAKLPGLAQALGAAAERTHRLAPLVGLMTEATATHVTHHANYQQLAEELIAYVPLGALAGSSMGHFTRSASPRLSLLLLLECTARMLRC